MTETTTDGQTPAAPKRRLDPGLPAFDNALEHGAFVRLTSADALTRDAAQQIQFGKKSQVLHFQYNPETMTRTRQGKWEARSQRRSGSPPPSERTARGGQGSSAVNAESEQITLKLVFDATEAILTGRDPDAEVGVLPELAFFEVTTLGKEGGTPTAKASKGRKGAQKHQPIRPDELLLVLGAARSFPVVITNLTITEQKYSPELVPVRAEVDLRLTVLEPGESAYAAWISKAFADLLEQRVANAAKAHKDSALDAVSRALTASFDRADAAAARAREEADRERAASRSGASRSGASRGGAR